MRSAGRSRLLQPGPYHDTMPQEDEGLPCEGVGQPGAIRAAVSTAAHTEAEPTVDDQLVPDQFVHGQPGNGGAATRDVGVGKTPPPPRTMGSRVTNFYRSTSTWAARTAARLTATASTSDSTSSRTIISASLWRSKATAVSVLTCGDRNMTLGDADGAEQEGVETQNGYCVYAPAQPDTSARLQLSGRQQADSYARGMIGAYADSDGEDGGGIRGGVHVEANNGYESDASSETSTLVTIEQTDSRARQEGRGERWQQEWPLAERLRGSHGSVWGAQSHTVELVHWHAAEHVKQEASTEEDEEDVEEDEEDNDAVSPMNDGGHGANEWL